MEQLDQQAYNLAKAIRKTETGGSKDPYTQKGASGEFGAYQFMPQTYKSLAKQHLGDENAPATVENQNKVAYMEIKRLKDAGKTPAEIASYWNSGKTDAYKSGLKGTNMKGVKYDVPAYVANVSNAYREFSNVPKAEASNNTLPQPSSSPYTGGLGTNPNDSLYGKILDNSITRGIQNFFPGKKVGEAIGTLGGYVASKNKDQYDLSAPTPLQVAGDIAQGALSIYGAKMPFKTTGIGRIAQGAKLGGYLGATGSIAEGDSAGDVLKNAGTGALTGGALSTLSEGASRLTKNAPKSLMQKAVGQKPSALMKGKSVAEYALEKKRVGTASSLIKTSQKEIDRLNGEIDTALKSQTSVKKASDVLTDLSKTEDAQNALLSKTDVKDMIERLVPESKKLLKKNVLTIQELNQLRHIVDKTIGDRGWELTQDSFNKSIMKSFANALRTTVKNTSGTHKLFSDLSHEIEFTKALQNKVAKGANKQILSFGDLIGSGVGSLAVPGIGAVAGLGARRAINSPLVQTSTAVGLRGLGKATSGLRKPILIGSINHRNKK